MVCLVESASLKFEFRQAFEDNIRFDFSLEIKSNTNNEKKVYSIHTKPILVHNWQYE